MKKLASDDVKKMIDESERAGNHIDDRLKKAVKETSNSFFQFIIEDKESFLSLIWQEISDTKYLTKDKPRTLKDVANGIIDKKLTFERLASEPTLGEGHKPEWFERCLKLKIDSEFDFKKFEFVTLVPATDDERKQSPSGSFNIYDGAHKSLVLSKLIIENKIDFQPIKALLLIPRPA
ncbi:MAG: hypothetical protein M1269_09570 [Chloroflexi bacterium]|nr:hypothetical protein [Chloroflexota bacterium]